MNEYPARRVHPSEGVPSRTRLILALLVVGVIVVASLAVFDGMSETFVHARAPPVAPRAAVANDRPEANCTDAVLQSVIVSPANISVKGLGTQVFNATAVSSCGSSMTESAVLSWALSASDLGTLNTTTGASVTYTACLAPMGGTLRVTGTFEGVSVTSRAAIDVWHASTPSTSSGNTPAEVTPDPAWVHVATLMVSPALAAAGVAVFLWGQRSPPRPRNPTR